MDSVEKITINRQTMITQLASSMFDAMKHNDEYMEEIIKRGFKGFNQYTNEDLINQYRQLIFDVASDPVVIELAAD